MGGAPADGLLLVDKPVGPTSQTVVTKVRRALGCDKAGHTGTLDPFATGLLLVCLGRATKLAQWLTGEEKSYRAEVALGSSTDTDDRTGKELSRADASRIDRAALESALAAFRGTIRQVPPSFSAIQKDGERMYDKARKGEVVELEPRDVTVHELVLEAFTPGPVARVVVSMRVSKGTYIRSIARDLGAALGVGGHLAELRRTSAGAYSVDAAIALDAVAADPAAALARLVPVDRVVLPMPDLLVTEDEAKKLAHGVVPGGAAARDTGADGLRRLVAPDGRALAVATLSRGRLTLDRVL